MENTDLIQQLEANLAAFEAAGLDEEAASTKKKLDSLTKPKAAPKTAAKKAAKK